MTNQDIHMTLFEILRIGLISLNNLLCLPTMDSTDKKSASEWACLCHTLPPMLMEEVNIWAVIYFCNVHGSGFLKDYPRKEDADFEQISELLSELRASVGL